MGSGDRIVFKKLGDYIAFGISFGRSPFALTIKVTFLFWGITIGLGKGYDHV